MVRCWFYIINDEYPDRNQLQIGKCWVHNLLRDEDSSPLEFRAMRFLKTLKMWLVVESNFDEGVGKS